ncbi:unnamed protein product [Prorocentrum cordatum]|uniref:Uncharacterized protein n=1 Tax=Prorocentrum cordatum TaxID=2364126 RepID=A0ABN9SMJ9_9DINO|nr:unnamed protein product [Polarella glacialis]
MGTAGGAAVASAPLLRPRFTCSRGGRRGGSVDGQFSTAHWLAPPASDVMSRLCASGPRSGTSALSRPGALYRSRQRRMGTAEDAVVASAPLLRPRFTCSRRGCRGRSVDGHFSTAHLLVPRHQV